MNKLVILWLMSTMLLLSDNLLKVGTYSWYKGGATASLTVKKDKANGYGIQGDALYGMSRKYGPNIGDLSFTGFMHNGQLVYREGRDEDAYILTLKLRKDGSFDISEKGIPPFGHNVSFAGHFTSDDQPSFACSKAKTFTEKAICDNKGVARLDRKMAKAYTLLQSGFFYKENSEARVERLTQEQRAWGKERNSCAKQQAYLGCYERLYLQRINRLDKAFGGLWEVK